MPKDDSAVRILIAEDHPIFRSGLRKLLEAEPGFQVVGEAANGRETVELARQLGPDVLLLDLAMPRFSGLEALRKLAGSPTPMRIIVLTAAIDQAQSKDALKLGARGIVLKESATELLLRCIRSVVAGEYWVGRETVSDMVKALHDLGSAPPEMMTEKRLGLTPREVEIVSAIVAGFTNKDIAEKLALSEHTVKHHLTKIFDKLGVSNRLELALFAIHHHMAGNP